MKTTFVSSQAVAKATRLSVMKMQGDVAKHSQELSSGRWADVGLQLGHRTGHAVELRQEMGRIDAILDTNGMVASRLDTSQAALKGVRETAEQTVATLVTLRNNPAAAGIAGPQAALDLKSMTATLNTNFNGQHIFAGINTDVKPIADYATTPPSPAKAAVDAAFLARFGMAQTDPAVSSIPAADMADFLDNQFTALFDDPAWSAWSSASDTNVKSRISTSELVDTSVNTNERSIRKLAMTYTMLSDLGGERLAPETYQAVVRKATEVAGGAVSDLANLQGRLGVAENRVKTANEKLTIQRDILNKEVLGLEGVDKYDTAARLNELMTQVEMSYSVTARIRQLSLLKYI
ncbi:flagellar hook-associated family protein [Salinarimonas soli]|uniref:Flagellin n=1 Tax=Salinarimonas soli TaxID=1638099 RepID=A0A5B2V6X9_9HYPH|nr:flagellar hook-associated family protein [Salinarimonas soli]KAA2234711.1 flagellar hook-associated family protein [Salinarimonas soli]